MKTTFALLKPDAADSPFEGEILRMIEDAGLLIIGNKRITKPTLAQCAAHFEALLSNRPEAFNRNVPYLLNGPVRALRITHSNPETDPIPILRELAGPTDPQKAKKKTIRGRFGRDSIARATKEGRGLRNVIHTADSQAAAWEEEQIWFYENTAYGFPKKEFTLEDNNGGDYLKIRVAGLDQIEVEVGHCCVKTMQKSLPVAALTALLSEWEENGRKTRWDSHPEIGPQIRARTKDLP